MIELARLCGFGIGMFFFFERRYCREGVSGAYRRDPHVRDCQTIGRRLRRDRQRFENSARETSLTTVPARAVGDNWWETCCGPADPERAAATRQDKKRKGHQLSPYPAGEAPITTRSSEPPQM